ncbi:MAG: long-chain fatty acid--CoA ligase [Candidatus Lustribacter sp.]|jgi:long-chain acyl-CoA synthetase
MTLVELVRAALAGPDRPLLHERDAGGDWRVLGTHATAERIAAIAAALRASGLVPGDRVALMSVNRVDWILAHLGILFAGGVTVPIYATSAVDQASYIIADSGARALFVDTAATAERLRDAGVALEPIVFDAPPEAEDSFAALIARGRNAGVMETAEPAPDDLAILIYTSGTTGVPKGVMLSHGNVATNAHAAFELVVGVLAPGDPVLSLLPFAHIYESTNVFGYLVRGAKIFVNRQIESLLDDLRSVRPVLVFCVPRVFERTYAGIIAKAHAAGGATAKLVPWAFAVGRRYKRAEVEHRPIGPLLRAQFALAHALVLGKLRARLGCERLHYFVSGSATLHLDVALNFLAADISIMEGYGLTECSPVVSCNTPAASKLGTVGRPIPGVEVRLADDGEILVRGPNVMRGYYRDPAETAAKIRDGWLATGDVGTLDADGYLRIVDRKKEIFKTSGGKYVSPARVEAAVSQSPFVAQVAVFGDGMPHPAALVSPNWIAVCSRMELPPGIPPAELAARADVRRFIAAECARKTATLATFEQIRWAGVLPRDLTIEDGELTPTLKVKRRVVAERFGSLIVEYTESRVSRV